MQTVRPRRALGLGVFPHPWEGRCVCPQAPGLTSPPSPRPGWLVLTPADSWAWRGQPLSPLTPPWLPLSGMLFIHTRGTTQRWIGLKARAQKPEKYLFRKLL